MKSRLQSCSLQLLFWRCHPSVALNSSIILHYFPDYLEPERSEELNLLHPSKRLVKVSQLTNNFLQAVTSMHGSSNKGSAMYLKTFVLFSGCICLSRKWSQQDRKEKPGRYENVSCSLRSKSFGLSFPLLRQWTECVSSACLSLTSHL